MGATVLTYSVTVADQVGQTPSVPCSESAPSDGKSGQLSVVGLTITGTNGTDRPVSISEIDFEIAGNSWHAGDSLVADASTIVAVPGDATPWAICSDRSGTWKTFPLPPATQIPPDGDVAIVFSAIVVNLVPNENPGVRIPITETSGGNENQAWVTVQKTPAVGPYVATPVIKTFTVDPPDATRGQDVTVTWSVENMEAGGSCQLTAMESAPGNPPPAAPQTLTPAAGGTTQLPVTYTTVFELVALNSGGTARADATAAVMPVAIESFTASPGTVQSGQSVTLDWKAEYATLCSIDHGVGPVALTGAKPVHPTQTTIYTLNATNGDQQVQRSVTVTVEKGGGPAQQPDRPDP